MLRWITDQAQRHRVLGLALLTLHAALLLPLDDPLRTSAVLIHFVLILLWQPFIERTRRFSRGLSLLAVAAGIAMIVWGGWFLLAAWTLFLLGLISGETPGSQRDTAAQWLAISHLFIGLLAGVAPAVFDTPGSDDAALAGLLAMASLLPLALLAIRAGPVTDLPVRFDPLRSFGVTLLTLLLIKSAVLWSFQAGIDYAFALIQALPLTGITLLVLNWAWQRAATHSVMDLFWNRYLLNIGTPFEQYLMRLSSPGAQALSPGAYLDHVLAALQELEWVEGVAADAPDGPRHSGRDSGHATRLHDKSLSLTVYTRRPPSPALRLHIQLLLRIALQIWQARRREAELRSQAHVQAVYETGARLTHDTKNLLQSLHSLSAAVSDTPAERAQEALDLVKRQLPPINQRLQSTLEKLREPAQDSSTSQATGGELVMVADWWPALQARYADEGVHFSPLPDGRSGDRIPRALFDTVSENLLENARYKRTLDRDIQIGARVAGDGTTIQLEIVDTGPAMPAETAGRLFSGAVASAKGLGVGLYQCARMAQGQGYELTLVENEDGQVRFALRGPVLAR